jgi:guanyl-specific ribonuclease Sa
MQGKPWLRLAMLAAVLALTWRFWPASMDGAAPREGSSPSPGAAAINAPTEPSRYPEFLPAEAVATLEAIERGGPFAYDRDGSVFQNRERRLPQATAGYYREYTVPTFGASDRGARRIVTGGTPPEVFYYTDDHYRTFHRIEPVP